MATVVPARSYRNRIYRNYATKFQNSDTEFDFGASTRWGRAYDYYLRRWLPKDRQAPIVDLACGGGKLLHFFCQRGYTHVQGVDVSPEQVRLARQILPSVIEADILDFLEGQAGRFRLVTGLDIAEHFTKDEVLTFLDLCYRALEPGGRLILQTPNADTPWCGYHRYNDLTHELCFQHNSLTNLMRTCGFSEIEHREVGPVPWGYSVSSSLRFMVWWLIRFGLRIYNLAETGTMGSGTFTRVFLIAGVRR
ncbi:MAG: class I SAM-dependent methyltransferase [Bryobacterales bacterium]|nr:class I SAM-dependent methyltransferase [Bryobacterales bacterium]